MARTSTGTVPPGSQEQPDRRRAWASCPGPHPLHPLTRRRHGKPRDVHTSRATQPLRRQQLLLPLMATRSASTAVTHTYSTGGGLDSWAAEPPGCTAAAAACHSAAWAAARRRRHCTGTGTGTVTGTGTKATAGAVLSTPGHLRNFTAADFAAFGDRMGVMKNFTAGDMDEWHKSKGSPAPAAKTPAPPAPPVPKVDFDNVASEPEPEPEPEHRTDARERGRGGVRGLV